MDKSRERDYIKTGNAYTCLASPEEAAAIIYKFFCVKLANLEQKPISVFGKLKIFLIMAKI